MAKSTFADRLRTVIEDFCLRSGVSVRQVARHHLKLRHEEVLRARMSRQTSKPIPDFVAAVAGLTGCRWEWLTMGEGPMYPERRAADGAVAEELERYGAVVPGAVEVLHVEDGSMDQGDYRPRQVMGMPGTAAESGDLSLVELRDGRRMLRKVFYEGESAVLVALAGSVPPATVRRAEIVKALKVWAVVLETKGQ